MRSVDNVEKLIERANAVPSDKMNRRTLYDICEAQEEAKRVNTATFAPNIWRAVLGSKAGSLAAALLIISSVLACLVLSGKVTDLRKELELARQDIPPVQSDSTTTINLYLKEHRDVVARHASFSSATPQPVQMRVNPNEILYYEFLNDEPGYMRPGIILRGRTDRNQAEPSEAPVISNGYILTLSEARKIAGFDLVARSWLHPGYKLDEIRRIEGRNALQLLYTDAINSVSLFEQPLDGQHGLSANDFREYAVYRKKEQAGGTILAWRDDELSYVLIGNTELSQLMDMAQSIGASN